MTTQTHRTIHHCTPTVHSREGIVWLSVDTDNNESYSWFLVRNDIDRLIQALKDAQLGPMSSTPESAD